jgi:hypothetical protein
MNSRFVTASAVTIVLALGSAMAADPKSGPQVGDSIPGPFNVLNVNGPQAGKSNCQV